MMIANLFRYTNYREWYKNIFLIICLLMIGIITVFIGVAPTHIFGHDTFFLLDNSWRVVNGQRTHLDYASAWGPLTFIIGALGLKLSNFAADGIGYGNAFFGLVTGFWSYALGRRRLRYLFRLLLSLFIVGVVVAPYALGFGVFNSTYAMVYNRYGYVLLCLILFESLPPVQHPLNKTEEWMGGISTGAAVALTLFLKASYFLAAILLICGISIICARYARRRLLGIVVGFTLVAAAFLAYLNFDIQAVFNDLRMAAGARSESLSCGYLLEKFTRNAIYLVAVILFGLASPLVVDGTWVQWKHFQLPLVGVLVFVADIFLLFTNQQWSELPLTATFILIVLNDVTAQRRREQNNVALNSNRYYLILAMVAAAIFLPIFASQYIALAHAAMEKASPPGFHSIVRFTQPCLKDLLLYEGETPSSNGRQYTTYVNDGVALLRSVSSKDETVFTIDMFNPFPFALGRKPPSGGIAAAAYRYTLSDTHRPSDSRYFGNADIVMVPKRPAAPNVYYDGVLKMYEPALKERYFLLTESDWWYVFRRKK